MCVNYMNVKQFYQFQRYNPAIFPLGVGSPILETAVCFLSLPSCGTPSLDGVGVSLSLEASLPTGATCSALGSITTFYSSFITGIPILVGAE